jgi:GH24 family phage-related lysozyme (muramidase)
MIINKVILSILIVILSFNTSNENNIECFKEDIIFKDPLDMNFSENAKKELKMMEGHNGKPDLIVYDINNTKTIGWGHSVKDSTYHIGQEISIKEANKLFENDIKIVENDLKIIFLDWKKEGIHIKLTQDQYDVLVSLGFNMGTGALKKSETLKAIKEENYKLAGELIKTQNVLKKYEKGLTIRRKKESIKFLSYSNNFSLF